MDVFIVTHSPRIENNERVVTTDVWRIFSEAKGSALFHNKGLDDIVKYYRERLGLKRAYVFSDGCRSQYAPTPTLRAPCPGIVHLSRCICLHTFHTHTYTHTSRYKGRNNFVCIAQFPSRHHGVELVHRFAASHRFKGPHDAYGKDAKHFGRTAEHHGKARLATTHNIYYFCATTLPHPRRGVTAEQLVTPLPPAPAPPPTPLSAEEQAAAAAALAGATTREAAEAMAERMRGLGVEVAEEATEVFDGGVEGVEGLGGEEVAEEEGEAAEAEAEEAPAEAEQARAEARVAGQAAEQDAEPDEEIGDFEPQDEFIFAADGTRMGRDHAEPALEVPVVAAPPVVEEAAEAPPPKKQKRAARTRQILSQAPGTEASSEGEVRVDEEKPRRPGIFTASNYFWLYYSAFPGLKEVAVGQLAEPGQCHGYLDDATDADADSIPGSNSTYEFAGVCPDQSEMLYTRTYACACRCCRELRKINTDYSKCPFMVTVGAYEQQTIRHEKGVAKQRTVQLMKTEIFAQQIKQDGLYAAFASYREKGEPSHSHLLSALGPALAPSHTLILTLTPPLTTHHSTFTHRQP